MTSESDDHRKPDSSESPAAETKQQSLEDLLEIPADVALSPEQVQQLLVGVMNDLRLMQPEHWRQFGEYFKSVLLQKSSASDRPTAGQERLNSAESITQDDVQEQLEHVYQDTQNSLIQIRQAVAQAMATEKQLEQQMLKNRDMAQTWQNRADMALQQHNKDLAAQAQQRKQQYADAADDLKQQLGEQGSAVLELRQRLTDTELLVQKLYTKKQVLIARYRTAGATLRAHEIISSFRGQEALAAVEELEDKVAEVERQVLERSEEVALLAEADSDRLLSHAILALERATIVMIRLEQLLSKTNGSGPISETEA